MKSIRPYNVTVYNRITGEPFARFYTNQVPMKGDHVTIFPEYNNEEDPFHRWGHWIVDAVIWCISHPASVTAFEVAKECEGNMAGAYCEAVELHVWPAEGPHWTKTPQFARALRSDDDDYDDDVTAPVFVGTEAAQAQISRLTESLAKLESNNDQ